MSPTPAGDPADAAAPGVRPPIVVAAPFVVLALAFVVTLFLNAALADALHGGWISLDQLAPFLAWYSFALYAAVFLWFDCVVVTGRLARPWTGVPAMLATTALAALVAGLIALVLAAFIVGATVTAMRADHGWPIVIATPVCLVVLAVVGGVRNVRTRRAVRFVPRPF